MRNLKLLLLLLLFNTLVVKGQTIAGRVLSIEDSKPIEYATVYIKNSNSATMTNAEGLFELEHMLGDSIVLAVSLIGYEPKEVQYIVNSGDVTISLAPSALLLDEVVVGGRSSTTALQDRGYALNNVSAQLATSQSFSTQELLGRSSGIKIRQGGGVGSDVEYSINGLSSGSVKVYIDGVPISSYGASYSVANIPASSIERVEVYKGVVPAHLADDALGGAINVITKKGGTQSLNVSYAIGSYCTHNVDVNGLYKSDKSGVFVGGMLHYNSSNNNYKVWGDAVYTTNPTTGRVEKIKAQRFHDKYSSYGAKITTGVLGTRWADELRFNLLTNNIDKDIQTGATMQTVYGNRRYEQQSYVGNVNYRKRNIIPRLDINTSFSYSFSNRTLIDTTNVKYDWSGKPVVNINNEVVHWVTTGEGGRATLAQNLDNSINSRTSLRYSFDKNENHTISFNGSFFSFNREIDDPMLSILEQRLTEARKVNKYTFSSSYDAKLFAEKLNISLFYKYFNQHLSLSDPLSDGAEIIPNKVNAKMDGSGYGLALSYSLTHNIKFNTSAEKALRLPSITEMIGNTSENIEANYTLHPERSNNLNIGVSIESAKIGQGAISGGVNFFVRDVNDMIQRGEVNQGDETYNYENIGKILSQGVDIELKYNYKRLFSIYGAVSYADARFNLEYDKNGSKYAWYGDRLRNMPYFTANGGVTLDIGKFSINYHLNYVHKFFKNWESLGSAGKATIPSQLSHDAGIVYKVWGNKMTLSIDAKNIFNAQLFDNYALQKMGRMIFAKINYIIF